MPLIAEATDQTAITAEELRLLDRVFASTPDLAFVFARDGRFLYVSPAAATVLRRRPSELVGHTWRELGMDAEVMTPFEADLQAVLATGYPLTNEIGLSTHTGFRRYEYSLSPLRDLDGHIQAVVALIRDITERKLAEEERERLLSEIAEEREHARGLAEQTQRHADQLSAVFDAMDEAVNVYDADGRLVRANPASVHTFGFDPAGMTREEIAQRVALRHPDGRPMPHEEVPASRALQGEQVSRERVLFTDGGGRERVALISIAPLRHDGQVTGAVGVWDEITDLEQALAELDTERRRLEAVVEQMPAAVILAEAPSGRILLMNRQAREMLSPPSGMVMTLAELVRYPQQLLHADGRAYHPDEYPLARSIRQGEVIVGADAELVLPEGQRRVLSINAGPIRNRQGRVIAAVTTFNDITARKRAEQERDAARQRLLETEREKKRFYREMIRAITHGKFCLVEPGEVPKEGVLVFEATLDGEASYRAAREHIKEAARSAGISDERARDLVLAAGEGITNAIRHGTDGRVAVYVLPDRIAVRISDRGPGVRAENLPASLLSPGFSTKISLGMGYTLILQLSDRVWLTTGPEGTTLQLDKWIHPEQHREPEFPANWDRL